MVFNYIHKTKKRAVEPANTTLYHSLFE